MGSTEQNCDHRPKSDWKAFVALVVSIFAFTVSIWQGWETRRHNRLAVRPVLEFWGDFQTADGLQGFFIRNAGFGPALVNKYRIYFDGKEIAGDRSEFFEGLMSKVGIDGPVRAHWTNFGTVTVIRAGDEKLLFGWDAIAATQRIPKEKIDQLNTRLRIRLTYCSLYDDCEPVEGP